jgi:hypothetical protein
MRAGADPTTVAPLPPAGPGDASAPTSPTPTPSAPPPAAPPEHAGAATPASSEPETASVPPVEPSGEPVEPSGEPGPADAAPSAGAEPTHRRQGLLFDPEAWDDPALPDGPEL